MKIYKKYLFRNLFKPLLISLLTLIGIIWSSRVVRFMEYIVKDGANFLSFFELTLLALPSLIMVILPLAVFLTTILTYNKLIENREIIILKNCGIKKIQLLSPLIFLSCFVVIISYFISLYGAHSSNLRIRKIRDEIANNISFSIIKEGVFSSFNDITIYADKTDSNKAFNIVVYSSSYKQKQDTKKTDILLQAELAVLNQNIITLYNGNFQRFEKGNKNTPEILFFDEYSVNFNELINNDRDFVIKKIDSLSIIKLFDILKNYEDNKLEFDDKNEIIYEINYRLTFPLVSILIGLFSGSLILKGAFNRMNNQKNIFITSLLSIIIYIAFLSLYQKISSNFIFVYILYGFMFLVFSISCYMIKERSKI